MAKATEEQVAGAEPEQFEVTLEEYCIRLSKIDKRVELIGAFNHVEKVAGRVKDSEGAFSARFAEFCNQPA